VQPAPAVQAAEEEVDEDYFAEEFLGDEEIDEEQILAADEAPEEQPELSPEDEAELDELLAEEEHLEDLDDLEDLEADSLVAEDAEALDDIELDREEEDVILSSLDAEREEPGVGPAEPLFERNFKALEEEGAAAEPEETWQLEQEDGGFAMAAEEEGEAAPAGEVIDLRAPEPAVEEIIEEMPASALEEVQEPEEELIAVPEEELVAVPEEELIAVPEEEEAVAVEFGEGETDVFAAEEEQAWKPKAPPSFVARPAEDFPEDAVREPFVGPQGEPETPEPPVSPRHTRNEELEDPDTLTPALSEAEEAEAAMMEADLADSVLAHEPEGEEEAAMMEADLADSVLPHELEGEEEAAAEDEFEAHPALSVLADDALGTAPGAQATAWDSDLGDLTAEAPLDEEQLEVELGEAPGEAEGEAEMAEMAEAFEPVTLEAPSAEVTRGEMDALLGDRQAAQAAATVAAGAAGASDDPEFDNLFASLREEIAANPEGEHLDDVLRVDRIRDGLAALEFSLPQHENTFARAMGIYAVPGDGEGPSAYPAALAGAAAARARPVDLARPAAAAGMARATVAAAPSGSAADVHVLSLLDPDIRAKLGEVLDEIISISVRKAVQEEMPKIMERLSKEA
jgi:hypothetical protein